MQREDVVSDPRLQAFKDCAEHKRNYQIYCHQDKLVGVNILPQLLFSNAFLPPTFTCSLFHPLTDPSRLEVSVNNSSIVSCNKSSSAIRFCLYDRWCCDTEKASLTTINTSNTISTQMVPLFIHIFCRVRPHTSPLMVTVTTRWPQDLLEQLQKIFNCLCNVAPILGNMNQVVTIIQHGSFLQVVHLNAKLFTDLSCWTFIVYQ